ncbi:MAG: DUF4339 domain-containing protein [Bacteroidetes bacterium]|nr:DUF4339 domain-containing protein [Bacteroidota bacterium]
MKKYFYSDGIEKFGPFTIEELRTKSLSKDILVWHQGLTDWTPLSEIDELKNLIDIIPPPLLGQIPPPISNYKGKNKNGHFSNTGIYFIFGIIILFGIYLTYNNLKTKTIEEAKSATIQEIENNEFVKKENERKRKQKNEEIIGELNKVKEEVITHQFRVLGGVTGITIKIENPTKFKFNFIKVMVTHFKGNGEIYKSDEVIFYNVNPYSSQIEPAPDSDRGTKLNTSIVAYESPDLPKEFQRNL